MEITYEMIQRAAIQMCVEIGEDPYAVSQISAGLTRWEDYRHIVANVLNAALNRGGSQ